MRSLRRQIFSRLAGSPLGFQVFPDFAAAASRSTGYEDDRVVDVVARKTERLRDELRPGRPVDSCILTQNLLAVVTATQKEPLAVVEVGGACGALFYEVDARLPGVVGRWQVVETPRMVARARSASGSSRLSFTDSLETVVDEPDLLIASGVLQCFPEPSDALRRFIDLAPRYLYLARTHVSEDGRPLYVRFTSAISDHGPGSDTHSVRGTVSIAMTMAPRSALEGALTERYSIEMSFIEGAAFRVARRRVRVIGLLASRKLSR